MATKSKSVAVVIASLFLLTNLAGLIHKATVQHVRCAEHNELIHIRPAATPDPLALAHGAGSLSSTGTSGENSHEHCTLPDCNREQSIATTVTELPSAVERRQPVVHPPCEVATGLAVYRLAPKTSPPV